MKTKPNKDGAALAAVGVIAVLLALTIVEARAQGYDTYAGNAGLVTTVQIEQAQRDREKESAFRGMSIADRWDASSTGSIARRWDSSAFGSIARRWENK